MDNFKKVFFSLLSVLVFLGLVFITFFSRDTSLSSEDIKYNIKDGVFSLNFRDNVFEEKEVSSSTGGVLGIERFGTFNTLLFSSGSKYFKTEKEDGATAFHLGSGEFLLDIGDVTKRITYSGSGFVAQSIGGGKILVSVSDVNKVTFFSLDSIVKIELTGLDDDKKKTEVYLYPHMSLSFNAKRNSFLQNADRIRISSVHDLDYYYKSVSPDYITDFISFLAPQGFSPQFLENSIQYQDFLYTLSKTSLDSIISKKSGFNIPGISYIQKYKMLFLNETKKKAYLETLILDDLITLIDIPGFKVSVYQETVDYLSQLEDIDPKESELFQQELTSIIYLFLQSTDEQDIETKKRLLILFHPQKTFNFKADGVDSALLLSNIYRKSDIGNDAKTFYQGIVDFIEVYTGDIGIKTTEVKQNVEELRENRALDYLTFFLEKILVPKEVTFSQLNFPSLIKIFNTYNSISQVVYGDGDESKARTALYINLNLIQNILNFLQASYFEDKRNERGLLVKKQNDSLSSEMIQVLVKNVDQIYAFFQDNKKYLSLESESKDSTIPADYELVYKSYKEYFLALLDYGKYGVEYDSLKQGLLDIQIWNSSSGTQLSKENFQKYFSRFSGVDVNSSDIQVSGNHYEVKNMLVDGQSLSFNFYPYNSGEISQIKINGEEKNVSYKLDVVQIDWADKYNKALGKDKEKFKFENFFALVFFTQKENNNVLIIQNESGSVVQEDSAVIVFKQDKLLGKNGLFRDIQGLKIKYSNIQVSIKGDTPDVTLSNVLFQKKIDSNGTPYDQYALFNGKFVVNKSETYFNSMTFKIYKNYGQPTAGMYFDGADIVVKGNIQLDVINEKLDKISQALLRLQSLDLQLSTKLSMTNISILYFLPQDKIILKFNSNGKDISLNLTGDFVDSFNFSGKNILNDKIKFTQINNYIP